MNEKAIDNSADGCLILILPVALLIIFLFATWPVLLALVVAIVSLNVWQRHQWQQWSQQVNPIFHRLIQESQGRITPLDLAMKANFSAATAKRYLESKAEEFGAQRQDYEDLGTVYYFITSSTLGSILDESEPPSEPDQQDEQPQQVASKDVKQSPSQAEERRIEESKDEGVRIKDESYSAVGVIAPESHTPPDSPIPTSGLAADVSEAPSHAHAVSQILIQSDLAKRLDVHSSTVYKRRDDPDFSEWTRSRDPEGIAWKFLPETKEFAPVEEE
ncbi:hypothetical protein [Chroococcidiopsis sp. CCMEE 29]|uniref:hypothetical protein n=1 Tax=Chroococcidiopsis sp. CCMEE 29 TaxID=155894 RepID=UPI0020223705|nr:hypothetical protein [Chroococcidiopsis sp. CCMEE 29]